MPININYLKKTEIEPNVNLVLFVNEKFNVNSLKKYLSNSEYLYINDLLKNCDLKKNLFVFDVNSKKKIVLKNIKNNIKSSDIENLGAEFYGRINHGKNSEYFVNSDSISTKDNNFLGYFLHGLKLKSYQFNKYKSKKEIRLISINIIGKRTNHLIKIKLNLNL